MERSSLAPGQRWQHPSWPPLRGPAKSYCTYGLTESLSTACGFIGFYLIYAYSFYLIGLTVTIRLWAILFHRPKATPASSIEGPSSGSQRCCRLAGTAACWGSFSAISGISQRKQGSSRANQPGRRRKMRKTQAGITQLAGCRSGNANVIVDRDDLIVN